MKKSVVVQLSCLQVIASLYNIYCTLRLALTSLRNDTKRGTPGGLRPPSPILYPQQCSRWVLTHVSDHFLLQRSVVWGLRIYKKYGYMVISSWGLIYPLSEHVDIFPVRLVPTFHWVFSVYLILAIYLHSRLYPCGRNKTLGLDPSHLV